MKAYNEIDNHNRIGDLHYAIDSIMQTIYNSTHINRIEVLTARLYKLENQLKQEMKLFKLNH